MAALLLYMAVPTTLILGRHTVYQMAPDVRAHLNSAFIAAFFVGGVLGSQLSSIVDHAAGWTAVTALGAVLPVLTLLCWTTEG